jgi:putative salt-induced outer membrane protein
MISVNIKTKLSIIAFTISYGAMAFQVQASQAETAVGDQKNSSWKTDAEVGISLTSGNTESSSYRGRVNIVNERVKWTSWYDADLLFREDQLTNSNGERETQTTMDKYSVSAYNFYKIGDYEKNRRQRIVAFASHREDEFSGVRKNSSLGTGYGLRLYQGKNSFLDGGIGPGYTFVEDSEGVETDEPTLHGFLHYKWNINDNASLSQKVNFEKGENTGYSTAETSLTTKISDAFSMKFSVGVTYNSDTPVGTETTDTDTSLTLVYSF